MEYKVKTPVVFVIFNRVDTTRRVFEAIRSVRPSTLYVIADGPRPTHSDDAERCAATRAILDKVDWPCEVFKNYSDENLGPKLRLGSGFDWVFSHVESAIVLEHDCLPSLTFFRFCDDLLSRYQYDDRIMHISGNNFMFGRQPLADSYYFSRYPHIWGWASWRRAWRYYDVHMRMWTESKNKTIFLKTFGNADERRFWQYVWDSVSTNVIQTWDYQWAFACITRAGLSITPTKNLVANIGFGADSLHSHDPNSSLANMPVKEMKFPLQHKASVIVNKELDDITRRQFFLRPNLFKRIQMASLYHFRRGNLVSQIRHQYKSFLPTKRT